MRARGAMALAIGLGLVLAGGAASAQATDPVQLGSSYVLDEAGVLSSSEQAEAEARLEQLSAETDVDLWVVYVPTFENPSGAEDWANAVADQNGLGPNQYLLAVATEGRQFFLSAYSEGPIPIDEIEQIEQQRIQPALADDDWAGAVDAAADGLTEASGGGSGAAGGGGFGGILIAVLVVAAIGLIIWLVVRSRRKTRATTGAPGAPQVEQLPTAELARRAASALVETDDAIKTSEQELGFARAQFGDAAAAEFAQTLADAKERLNRAFTLKQQLDDHEKDTEQQVREWNGQIIALCDEAGTALDEKAAAFDELRKLEQNAPEALARVQDERATAEAALDASAARLQTLTSSYAPDALVTVADNPAQARERLVFADAQLAAAQAAIGAGDGGAAAVGIRAAEEAVGQAELLEQAIGKLASDLAAAEQSAAALVAELETDLASAAALPDADGRVAAVVAVTRTQVDAARPLLAGSARRPIAALQALQAANTQIDTVVAAVRDAQAQADKARRQVGQLILQAQAQVSAAEDYITARRGAVGATARTRLAEAGAALVLAQQLQATDPTQALQHAQRADQLAGQAIQSAQQDVGGFGGMGGGSGGGGDNGMLGAILGGIVLNNVLGGGGGGSSRSSGGSLGGIRIPSGGGGGMRPGSFGGGGTRARRGGGRF